MSLLILHSLSMFIISGANFGFDKIVFFNLLFKEQFVINKIIYLQVYSSKL